MVEYTQSGKKDMEKIHGVVISNLISVSVGLGYIDYSRLAEAAEYCMVLPSHSFYIFFIFY